MSNKYNRNKSVFYFSRPSPFPQLDYVGYVGIIIGIVQLFSGNNIQAIFIIFIAIIILLMRSWSLLNIGKMTLTDFFGFIPYRNIRMNTFFRILITEEKVTRTLNSRGNTSTINYLQYKIILVTEGGKVLLQEDQKREKLEKKGRLIAKAANVEFENLAD